MVTTRLRFAMGTLLSLALLALAVAAASAAPIVCPRAAFPPTLDGRLDDWPPLPHISVGEPLDWHPASPQFADYGGPEDISADVWLSWDSQALYLAIETRDDHLVRVRSAAEIDRGDSLVLTLTGDGASQSNQFVIAMLKATSLVWRSEPAQQSGEVRTIGRALAVRENDLTHLVYELAIPWSELVEIRPRPGAGFTLTVSACDDDGDGMKGCLERTVSVVLSTVGIGPPQGAPAPSAPAPSFPSPKVARFDNRCFTIQGRDTLLLGGEVEYARLPETAWRERVSLLRAAGLNLVSATVPWSHHQPTPAAPDLTSLGAFLALCKEEGVWVQLHIGPFAGERWPAGAVPGWIIGAPPRERARRAQEWLQQVLPVAAEHQMSNGGSVALLVAQTLPGEDAAAEARGLERLYTAARSAGIVVPIATANSPAARRNTTQALVNIVDTLSFYHPVEAAELAVKVHTLAQEEIGPPAITSLTSDTRSAAHARRSMDQVRVALARGATAVTLGDFAPGMDPTLTGRAADRFVGALVEPSGARTSGYGEARLLGSLVETFGAALARTTPAEGVAQADSPGVRALVRYGTGPAFLFLWDEEGVSPHALRLTYLEPDTDRQISIPEAGTIHLPAGGAKVLVLDLPLGRGIMRYCTSEIAALLRTAERTVLVLYGDPDTPGEIALRLPGPPLVTGEVARQSWNPQDRTLVLDYYHGERDHSIMVDEIQIIVLSRQRAASLAVAREGEQAFALSAGTEVLGATVDGGVLRASLDCRAGAVEVTAALPRPPTSVTVDGEPIPFTFATPDRVLSFQVETLAFADQRRPTSVWDRLGRAVAGGPPHLRASFDRSHFALDTEARAGECATHDSIAVPPEAVGLLPGRFARLRTSFETQEPAELSIVGSRFPSLVAVNGRPLPALSGDAPQRRDDLLGLLRSGANDLEMTVYLPPRPLGLTGLRDEWVRLPEVLLITAGGETSLTGWTVCPGLAGESARYADPAFDARGWRFLRFGPWREQGRDLAEAWGAVWYRMPFTLPRTDGWTIPYRVELTVRGIAEVFLNGRLIGVVADPDSRWLPVPSSLARPGEENVLVVAVAGSEPEAGLYRAEVAADLDRMTQRREVEIGY